MTLAEFLLARVNEYWLRAIIELHTDNDVHECLPTMQVWPWFDTNGGDIPCPTLRLVAMPYAGHPDFRPEWKLDG